MKFFISLVICTHCVFHNANAQNLSVYGDIVSLSKFGVVGDGKADDTKAIQKAIDYCESNSIKTLFIPNGNYLLKSPVYFRRGGVQIRGVGALLREESWLDKNLFVNNKPFSGCSFIIPRNSNGFIFSSTVADPISISDVQFASQSGRTPGKTTAVLFQSEFWGPTWPFIIERCHFRGFNYAIKFESKTQYCVAFVQVNQSAFSQNDECIYFSDIPKEYVKNIGQRNLAWGFTFANNKCHDNSRVIRGCFAKDAVNIMDNNMEGNIPYADNSKPTAIVDIEISLATVNFEGNHFESVISDCVSISSAFRAGDGGYYSKSGSTTGAEGNKVFIKGNNFDGISGKFKPYILKSLVVFNYDPYGLYIDECDIRTNAANNLNLLFSDHAKQSGTSVKFPTGKYENSYKSLSGYGVKKYYVSMSGKTQKLSFSSFNSDFLNVGEEGLKWDMVNHPVETKTKYLGCTFIINNPTGVSFLGIFITFNLNYKLNGKRYQKAVEVPGTYGSEIGFVSIAGYYPLNLPKGATDIFFNALLNSSPGILGGKRFFLANEYSLFTYSDINPPAIPVF